MRRAAPEAGLCDGCAHHVEQESARGSTFHRCARADVDARLRRYPPIPVRACVGFEPAGHDADATRSADTTRAGSAGPGAPAGVATEGSGR